MRGLATLFALWAGGVAAMTLEDCEARVTALFETYPRTVHFANPAQAVTADGWCRFTGAPDSSRALPPDLLDWRLEEQGEETLVYLRLAPITPRDPAAAPWTGEGILRYRKGQLLVEDAWYGQGPGDRIMVNAKISGVDLSSRAMAHFSIGSAQLETARLDFVNDPGRGGGNWIGSILYDAFDLPHDPSLADLSGAIAEVETWPDPPFDDSARAAVAQMLAAYPDLDGSLRMEATFDPPQAVTPPVLYLLFGEVRQHGPSPMDAVTALRVTGAWTQNQETSE